MNVDHPVFPRPWRLAPRDRKYYGTEVLDANGEVVFKIWGTYSWGVEDYDPQPSERELDGQSLEEFWEWCCDSHWETEDTYQLCQAIVDRVNAE